MIHGPRAFASYDHERDMDGLRDALKDADRENIDLAHENDELAQKAQGWSDLFSAFGAAFLVFFIWEWWWGSSLMGAWALAMCVVALLLAWRADPDA